MEFYFLQYGESASKEAQVVCLANWGDKSSCALFPRMIFVPTKDLLALFWKTLFLMLLYDVPMYRILIYVRQ